MSGAIQPKLIEGLIEYVSGGDPKLNSDELDGDINKFNSIFDCAEPDNIAALGPAVEDQEFSSEQSDDAGSRTSVELHESLTNIPLHVRARAEAWEIPRNQLQLTKKIGEGDGGVVYQCKWRGLDCAAKLLTQESKSSSAYYDMMNEISVLSHLRHPNLVLFLGACTVGNGPLLILSEFMAGSSLENRFDAMNAPGSRSRRDGYPWRPPLKLALQWIMELSRAVVFLHSCQTPIIHRDLKPANLLLTEEDHLKVSDFGLSKTLKKLRPAQPPYSMTGNTGTLRYMAPEVVLCNPSYNEKVDVYSMGMIFWYILVGVKPFDGVEPSLIADLAARRAVRPPTEGMRWPEMEGLVSDMWAHDPDMRPTAMAIVPRLAALGPAARPEPAPAGPIPACYGSACHLM